MNDVELSSAPPSREEKRDLYGEGPWLDEPDRVEWRHEGLPCLIVRGPLGALCGYVAVPREHLWHRRHYDNVDATAHGGLTFAGPCHGQICHVPEPGEPADIWWLGFDCAHFRDLAPKLEKGLASIRRLPVFDDLLIGREPDGFAGGVYRDVAYVTAEVDQLAEQAVSVAAWIEYRARLARARTKRQRKQAEVFAMLAKRLHQKRDGRARPVSLKDLVRRLQASGR